MMTIDTQRALNKLKSFLEGGAFASDFNSVCAATGILQELTSAPYVAALKCYDVGRATATLLQEYEVHQTHSKHALCLIAGSCDLVSFFADAHTNVIREKRLYNLVVALSRTTWFPIEVCRRCLVAVCVAENINKLVRVGGQSLSAIHSHYAPYVKMPWDYDPSAIRAGVSCSSGKIKRVDNDLRKLSGYIFEKVYYVFPNELDAFARWRGW